ncbi:MAG: cysteine desulfurase [Candidatus Micrarchaeota archaeon]|nr:MAG: cysteine desulfurase [Candidatus Micrarchaeota archaeon]
MYDVDKIREDFPILKQKMRGKPLVYLDSAATSQKPYYVIDAIDRFYKEYNANIHRGIYEFSERSTEEYTESKELVKKFINARSYREIIYVRNTTEAINLVALTYGNKVIEEGDHILITEMEHHSNLVPWQLLAERKGAILDYVKVDMNSYKLDLESLEKELEKKPKIVAVTHVSNVLGTVNDIKYITKRAHEVGATVLVDGAQSVPHMKVDVRDIDCDFLAFSGHKMLGPTGIGCLYGREEILEETEPLYGGGDMIMTVEKHSHTWNELPWKFEAGTSNIEGGIGLKAAIEYLNKIGMDNIKQHERELTEYALKRLDELDYVTTFGPRDLSVRAGVISFEINGVHPHDVAQIFDSEGIAIRAGHHCAMPLVTELTRIAAVSRMSFYLYNKKEEIDRAVEAIEKTYKIFKGDDLYGRLR